MGVFTLPIKWIQITTKKNWNKKIFVWQEKHDCLKKKKILVEDVNSKTNQYNRRLVRSIQTEADEKDKNFNMGFDVGMYSTLCFTIFSYQK